jgi:hypothetical protein
LLNHSWKSWIKSDWLRDKCEVSLAHMVAVVKCKALRFFTLCNKLYSWSLLSLFFCKNLESKRHWMERQQIEIEMFLCSTRTHDVNPRFILRERYYLSIFICYSINVHIQIVYLRLQHILNCYTHWIQVSDVQPLDFGFISSNWPKSDVICLITLDVPSLLHFFLPNTE